MTYTFDRKLTGSFDQIIDRTIAALKAEGFGVLSDIDIRATLKTKIGAEFRPYRILGACNPPLAYRALQAEDRIGAMLPCNVIVQEKPDGVVVSAINPLVGMEQIGNPALTAIAIEVSEKLKRVLAAI
jgi:uncharacterized protein (DUF302 family)